jgi:DNA repair protein RecO (recombination protein O)
VVVERRVSAPELATEAVVLGGVDYGDADRIVTLFTPGRGKLSAFAAGARKSKRRFAGVLEPFTVLDARLNERRGDLLFLASATIVDAHAGLREDLGRIAHAGHAAELCRELTRDREPQPELYDRLRRYLGALARSPARPEDLLAFELCALGDTGVAPRLDDCAICGGAVEGVAAFDVGHGGFLCGRCERAAYPGALRVDPAARAAVAALQAGPFAGVEVPDPRLRAGARAVVRRFTHHLLGRSPRSLEVLSQLGIEG